MTLEKKLKNKKILVLDDEEPICQLINGILEGLDLDIFEANTMREAETLLEDQKFDLLILDYNVGDGVGWSLLEKTPQNHQKYGKPAFLLISGTVGNDILEKYIDKIETEFLPKPFGIDNLKEKVISLLSK